MDCVLTCNSINPRRGNLNERFPLISGDQLSKDVASASASVMRSRGTQTLDTDNDLASIETPVAAAAGPNNILDTCHALLTEMKVITKMVSHIPDISRSLEKCLLLQVEKTDQKI